MKNEESRRHSNATELSRLQFEELGLCDWKFAIPVLNGAFLECTPAELKALISERPAFVAGIYIGGEEEDQSHFDGETFRSDVASRLGRYLDVAPGSETHTGLQSTPSGSSRITVSYGDAEGFYQVQEHPAFMRWSPFFQSFFTRVIATKECGSQHSGCIHEPNQSSEFEHGAKVIGAFQSILDGQDPNFPSPAAQQLRSHGAYNPWLRLYHTSGSNSHQLGLMDASAMVNGYSQTDIWVGGQGSPNISDCNDVRGWNWPWMITMDWAYNNGLFAIYGAGNRVHRFKSECSTKTYASRSDVLGPWRVQ